jgi:hypothetical protein
VQTEAGLQQQEDCRRRFLFPGFNSVRRMQIPG